MFTVDCSFVCMFIWMSSTIISVELLLPSLTVNLFRKLRNIPTKTIQIAEITGESEHASGIISQQSSCPVIHIFVFIRQTWPPCALAVCSFVLLTPLRCCVVRTEGWIRISVTRIRSLRFFPMRSHDHTDYIVVQVTIRNYDQGVYFAIGTRNAPLRRTV